MKKLMLAACLMFGGATLVSAQVDQTTPGQTQSQTQDQDQDRQQIAVSELPDQVTAKLEGQDYAGWTVGNAYKKMDESNQEMYIVELRQGTETKKVKFDKDGNELDKGKHGDESSNYRNDASQTDPSATPDQSTSDQSATPDQSTSDQSATDQSTSDQSTSDQSTTEQSTTDQADNSGTATEQQ